MQAEPSGDAPDAALAGPDSLERLVDVGLTPRPPPPEMPRGAEVMGLVTALLELGLADLDGVCPHTAVAPVSPGLDDALHVGAERRDLYLSVVELPWTPAPRGEPIPPHGIELVLSSCEAPSETAPCELARSRRGTREDPTPAVDDLLDQLAGVLLAARHPEVLEDARTPPSADPYAILLAGRSAASWYGLLPATPEPLRGDKRRDPVARALLVDPDTAVGNWISGRRELVDGRAGAAALRLELASFARPSSLLLMADAAAGLSAAGRFEAAWTAWLLVEAARPGDPRFALGVARAALAAGHPEEARARLDALPGPHQRTVEVASLRARVAEALGLESSSYYDQILAIWQQVDPADAEPVRRRVLRRARATDYADALPLIPELETRAGIDEASRTAMSLEAALGRYAAAAARAEVVGEAELARRLRARAATTPTQRLTALGPPEGERAADPVWLAARAEALLCAGDVDGALETAQRALVLRPALPEALDVAARAAGGGSSATYARLRRLADPDLRPGTCDG